uniref:Putative H/ACA ribonucleoprotein complex subunit 3 n=1 Tax=Ulva partita TaxID=1605170 RepID=A0A1C9ZPY2_9CHLO|nr:putative H/ACA ribonucleoprotein complex subunit 3 [Ulva partita]
MSCHLRIPEWSCRDLSRPLRSPHPLPSSSTLCSPKPKASGSFLGSISGSRNIDPTCILCTTSTPKASACTH